MYSSLSLTAVLTLATSLLSSVEAIPRLGQVRRDGVPVPYSSVVPSVTYGSSAPSSSPTSGGSYNFTTAPYGNSTGNSTNSTSTTWQSSQPSQPALLPAVHWNYDTSDIRNLAPMDSCNLYYSANGVSGMSNSYFMSCNINPAQQTLPLSTFSLS